MLFECEMLQNEILPIGSQKPAPSEERRTKGSAFPDSSCSLHWCSSIHFYIPFSPHPFDLSGFSSLLFEVRTAILENQRNENINTHTYILP